MRRRAPSRRSFYIGGDLEVMFENAAVMHYHLESILRRRNGFASHGNKLSSQHNRATHKADGGAPVSGVTYRRRAGLT